MKNFKLILRTDIIGLPDIIQTYQFITVCLRRSDFTASSCCRRHIARDFNAVSFRRRRATRNFTVCSFRRRLLFHFTDNIVIFAVTTGFIFISCAACLIFSCIYLSLFVKKHQYTPVSIPDVPPAPPMSSPLSITVSPSFNPPPVIAM